MSLPNSPIVTVVSSSETESSNGIAPSKHSELTAEFVQRMMDGMKRMHEDEEYRLSIAKMLS